jgi:hypothetical protein
LSCYFKLQVSNQVESSNKRRIYTLYQSGLNGCCTAMWKANGNTTTLLLFLDNLFPKTDTHARNERYKGDRSDRKTRKKT